MKPGVRRESHPVFLWRAAVRPNRRATGFTLMEFIAVAVIVAIIAVVALVTTSTGPAVAGYQADGLKNSIRHMQELAMTWGKPLQLTAVPGSYSVSCVTAGSAPCNASPVIDPATGSAFSVSAESGITFAATSLAVDELGRPATCSPGCTLLGASTTLNVSGGGKTWAVQVSPLTGFITVN